MYLGEQERSYQKYLTEFANNMVFLTIIRLIGIQTKPYKYSNSKFVNCRLIQMSPVSMSPPQARLLHL